jgi:putative transposase
VRAELVLGQGSSVGHQAVERPMRAAGLRGLSGRPRDRQSAPPAAATDRVGRQFAREAPDQLWVTDIAEHPTRAGKAYCAVVLDACSRRVVGWSIDAAPTAALATNALGMAIDARRPAGPAVLHSDQGTQYGAWAFTRRARDAGCCRRWARSAPASTMP